MGTHIEIQGQKEDDFPERMFLYEFRIYDKYRQKVIGCAVLTDANPTWRPDCYEVSVIPGSFLKVRFITIKLLDYRGKEAELEASDNPFASVILAQLAATDLNGKPAEQRKRVKFALTKRLYEKGYTRQKVLNLYKFIDWLIGLPEPFEIEYLDKVYELEEATKMAYISTAERLGVEKGIVKGIVQGSEKEKIIIAKRLLSEGAEISFIAKITKLPVNKIEKLKETLSENFEAI